MGRAAEGEDGADPAPEEGEAGSRSDPHMRRVTRISGKVSSIASIDSARAVGSDTFLGSCSEKNQGGPDQPCANQEIIRQDTEKGRPLLGTSRKRRQRNGTRSSGQAVRNWI